MKNNNYQQPAMYGYSLICDSSKTPKFTYLELSYQHRSLGINMCLC